MRFEGTINIAIQIEAEDIEHALKILDENPFECKCNHIGIVVMSENHDVYPMTGNN